MNGDFQNSQAKLQDFLQKSLKSSLNQFVGGENTPQAHAAIKVAVGMVFTSACAQEQIEGYQNLQVKTHPDHPNTIEINVDITPAFSLEMIHMNGYLVLAEGEMVPFHYVDELLTGEQGEFYFSRNIK